jgi:hypothetical protein
MTAQLQIRRRGNRSVNGQLRLSLGPDGEDAVYALQAFYSRHLDRPVSRPAVIRRALLALLDAINAMTPDNAASEASALLRLARIA